MAQHGLKQKVKLPSGVKQKIKKVQTKKSHPRKGSNMILPPKRQAAISDAKSSSTVSKIINQKNESMVRVIADKSQGRNSSNKSK